MDINKYWREVHREMERLADQPMYYLMSLDNSDKGTNAGRVCDIADRKEVARRLVENTHRLATPAEIEQFEQDQKRQNDELAAIELKRKQQFAMPQELQTLIQMAAASVLPSSREALKPNKEK